MSGRASHDTRVEAAAYLLSRGVDFTDKMINAAIEARDASHLQTFVDEVLREQIRATPEARREIGALVAVYDPDVHGPPESEDPRLLLDTSYESIRKRVIAGEVRDAWEAISGLHSDLELGEDG